MLKKLELHSTFLNNVIKCQNNKKYYFKIKYQTKRPYKRESGKIYKNKTSRKSLSEQKSKGKDLKTRFKRKLRLCVWVQEAESSKVSRLMLLGNG